MLSLSPLLHFEVERAPYFAYTITQLWRNFLSGNVSETSIIELAALLQQISDTQRQKFSEHQANFYPVDESKLKELRWMFRQLEIKLENNVLLPSNEKHPLSPVDQAILNILPFNIALLRWVTLRYEFIMFTNRALCNIILEKGVMIEIGHETLTSYDLFSFISYVHHKTKDTSDRKQKRIQLLRHLLDIDDLAIVLNIDTFDLIKTNPLTPFCNELLQLAKNTGAVSQRRATELLTLMAQHPNFLTSSLDDVGNAFLHHVFAENNTEIIHWLVGLPYWGKLSQTLHRIKNWSLFDVIAITGHTEHYSLLKNIHGRSDWPFAMTWAVKKKHNTFCELLLNDGIDPNCQYGENDRILIIAARKGYVTICRLLLKHGANPNEQCSAGYSPLAFAAKRGKGEVCTLLLEHGADNRLKTKKNKTAEELWSGSQHSNPFKSFQHKLRCFALNTDELTGADKNNLASRKTNGFLSGSVQQGIQQTVLKETVNPDKTKANVLASVSSNR